MIIWDSQAVSHAREGGSTSLQADGPEMKFKEAIDSIKSKKLDLDITKEPYSKLRKECNEIKKKGDSNMPSC